MSMCSIAIVSAFLLWILVYPQGAFPQGGCPSIPSIYSSPTTKGMWPQGSTVNVNIDPTFTLDQKSAIVAAIDSWNQNRFFTGNDCHVTLASPSYSATPLGSSFFSYNLQSARVLYQLPGIAVGEEQPLSEHTRRSSLIRLLSLLFLVGFNTSRHMN